MRAIRKTTTESSIYLKINNPGEMNGWIKLHRKLRDSEVFSDTNAYHVFSLLMLSSDRKGCGKIGRHRAASELRMNPNTFYKALKRCEKKYGLVTLNSNNAVTTFSLKNWGAYQSDGNSEGNNQVTTGEQRGNTIQERRKKNKNKKKINKRKRILELVSDEYVQQVATDKRIKLKTAISIREDLILYCESHGKSYQNYKSAFQTFVNKAIQRDKSIVNKPVTTEAYPVIDDRTPEEKAAAQRKLDQIRAQVNQIGAMPS